MILRNKKLFLLLKDSICEFILLSLVILLSRHSFIYIKIIQFRILQGNLSESSPVGWSVVCCNQTKVVPSHAYNRRTVKPPFCENISNKKLVQKIDLHCFRHSSLRLVEAEQPPSWSSSRTSLPPTTSSRVSRPSSRLSSSSSTRSILSLSFRLPVKISSSTHQTRPTLQSSRFKASSSSRLHCQR